MMLTPGKHAGRVVSHNWTTSQAGTPGLNIRVEIPDEFAGTVEEITGTIWLSPKAMGMARMQFRAFKFNCDEHELAEIGDGVSFIGMDVDVILKEEEYKGRKTLKVDRFGAGSPPPTKEALTAATTALRKAKKSPKFDDPNAIPPGVETKEPEQPATPVESSATSEGGDIPF